MVAPWFSVATHFKGLAEVHGSTDNPKIVEMFRISGHPEVQEDETPWCAAFVGACLRLSGYRSSGSLGARSYHHFGRDLGNSPQRGCIVVFSRGDPPHGHVGFFDHEEGDQIHVLGGNQSDAANVRSFPKIRWLAYRWPTDTAPLPATTLPTILQIDPDNAPRGVVLGNGVGGEPPDFIGHVTVPDPDIRAVQSALAALNFDPGPIDGEDGPLTRAALEAFQRDRGLLVTGAADVATRRALGLVVGPPPVVLDGGATGMTAADLLRMILGMVVGNAAGTAQKSADGGVANVQQILQAVLAALLGKPLPAVPSEAPAAAAGPASTTTPALSFIDKLLGGEALAGKKTLLAILAYVVLAILQATGVVGPATGSAATTTGQILTTLIAAFGGLGVVSKIDRVVQILGLIAAKRPSPLTS